MADDVDRLYGLPLAEFTPARDELAKRLRREGDREAAERVRRLKKPTVSAWAANQLARRREVDVQRLLRAGERLEQAQREIVRGGEQGPFEEARAEERDAVRRLRASAAELLREAGQAASDATLERLARTLHAAAATDEGRDALREARLTEDLEPLGFGAFASLADERPRRERPRPAARAPAVDRRRLRKAREEAAAAREAAEHARARARESERALKNAEREAAKTRKEAEQAAERAERLETRARELDSV